MCSVAPAASDYECLNTDVVPGPRRGANGAPETSNTETSQPVNVVEVGMFKMAIEDVQAVLYPTNAGHRQRGMNDVFSSIQANSGSSWKYRIIMATLSALTAALQVAKMKCRS